MRNRVCYASIGTLSKLIGVSRWTFHKHLGTLLVAGELVDETPGRQGRPHKYHTVVHIGAVDADDSPECLDGPVQKSHASLEEPVMSVDTPVRKPHTPVRKPHTRITTKETTKEASRSSNSLFSLIEDAGILLNRTMAEQYSDIFEDADNPVLIERAFKEAASCGSCPTPNWLRAVIRRCKMEGRMPGDFGDWGEDQEDEPRAPPMPRAYVHPFSGKVVEINGESSEGSGRPTAE